MKKLLLFISFAVCSLTSFAGDAEIKKAWIDSFGFENDVWGLYAHAGFVINDCKGQSCSFIVYLKDTDGNYIKNVSGNTVSFSSTFYPASNNSKFHDYRVFCPLSKMGITSSSPAKNYYFVIYIRDGKGKFIGNSSSMKMTY